MKTTFLKKGIVRIVPESTFDSYKLGLLIGNWKSASSGSRSIFTINFSSDSDNPLSKLNYIEFPFDGLFQYICCILLSWKES